MSSVPSVFISSISSFSSSFCRCCLCQVTRQLFPSSLVRVLWAVAFEYNGPVDAPSLPLWLHQYFLLSLSLSFLPPSLLQGSRLLFARLGFLQSSVLSTFLYPRTVFSLVLCHDAVFGWSDRPSFPPSSSLQLFSVSSLGLQEHVTMSFVDEENVDEGDDCTQLSATCTLSSFFTTFPTASRVSSQEN